MDGDGISPEALLFQTGHLAVGGAQEAAETTWCSLQFPDLEVRSSLAQALLSARSPGPGQALRRARQLPALLEAGDSAGIEALSRAHFASIPHDWYRNDLIAAPEGYHASASYTFFASLGLDTVPEGTSSTGRLDLAVHYAEQVFLFELKAVDDSPTGAASSQIKDRRCADKYLAEGIPLHLVGVELSTKVRNIVGFDTETSASTDL